MKKTHSLTKPIRSKEEGSILAALFRTIIRDLGILNRFDDVIKKAATKNKGKKNKTEHAITNVVCGDKMTLKVFIYILKDVLNVISFKLTIELRHHNKTTTIHTLKEIKLKEIDNESSNNEDDESNGKQTKSKKTS